MNNERWALIDCNAKEDPTHGIPRTVLVGDACAGCGESLEPCGIEGHVRLQSIRLNLCGSCLGKAQAVLSKWVKRRMDDWMKYTVLP